jgi:putative secretion ATPase (PEP-CTERM system associated)
MFDDFYGLAGRPFQLTPDPQFYFESATHRKALSYLGYGLAQGEGFIVITGEVGAGKSTLVAHLMRKVDPAQLSVGQIVTSNLDGEELIHVAAQSFGLEIDGHDKASALCAIEGFLHEEARAGRRCLLVVDESQNLSVEALEELRMLSNFQLGAHPLLQMLLLGQPEFKHLLAKETSLEQLRQRVIAAHHLEPMPASEIEPYVMHRLKCVGWRGNPSFDPEVFEELHAATGGIPRRLNQLMSRLMLLGAVEQKSRIDAAVLASVRNEMDGDSAPAEPRSAPKATEVPAPPSPQPIAMTGGADAQFAELHEAIAELTQAAQSTEPLAAEFADRIESLELRVSEQERAVRHVLTMLIEWFEGESPREAA